MPLNLSPPPTNKTKQNSRKRRKKIKWKKNRNKIKKSCHRSCSATQRATSRTPLSMHLCLQVSSQRVIGLVRGPYWAPNLHGHPAAARSCRDPAALGLRVRFLRMLQQIIHGVGLGTRHVITLGLGLAVGLIHRMGNEDSSPMVTVSGLIPHTC